MVGVVILVGRGGGCDDGVGVGREVVVMVVTAV